MSLPARAEDAPAVPPVVAPAAVPVPASPAGAALPAAPDAAPATQIAAPPATLPEGLSVSSMFTNADMVVKAVMLGLIVASVLTWTILLAKGIEIVLLRRGVGRELRLAEPARRLAELRLQTAGTGALAVMIAAAAAELKLSEGGTAQGVKERVEQRLRRIEAGLGRRLARGTGLLATIGATAPFVGLFGTVWGIMNSFIGIARLHTTNLAVVAPGIAEALLATACGLVAAIPAVVIYNLFARGIGGYRASLGDLSTAVQVLVSRDLDLRRGAISEAAE